jgi:hypothetical protein
MKMLDRSVKVRSRFLRSTRLDAVDSQNLLDGFVLHGTGAGILSRVIDGIICGEQRAFTWTGAYGSGKSTLALYLTKLLSSEPKDRSKLKPKTKGSASQFGQLVAKLDGSAKPWLVVSIVGQKTNVEEAIRSELSSAIGVAEDTDASIVDVLNAALKYTSESYAGLLVVIDELGRHLEHAAEGSKSLHVLQEIAEIFARSDVPAGFIGLLHQAIHDYLPRTDRLQRQEWEKIQGRFTDLLFGLSIEESISLISSAIEGRKASQDDRDLIAVCCGSLATGRLSLSRHLEQYFRDALPLHPYTAVFLCLVARQRFGQNERSLFSFLASGEPAGLQEYAHSSAKDEAHYYTVDRFFDYLQINVGRSIAAVEGLGQWWSDAEECVTRAEHLDPICASIVKVISLSEVFGRSINLVATKQFLDSALPQFSNGEIGTALKKVQENSIIEYRQFKGGYALTLGSDIDLDAELAKLRNNMQVDDIEIDFASFASLKPIVAKQHYHSTGTQRYFDIRIASISRLNDEKISPLDPFFDGAFLLLLKDGAEDGGSLLSGAEAKKIVGWDAETRPVLISIEAEPQQLYAQAQEVSVIKRLSRELLELQNDKVARRRVQTLAQDAEAELVKRIKMVLLRQDWTTGLHLSVDGPSMSAAASYVADSAYNKCPPVRNELINRHKPSAAATKARRILMNLMGSHGDQPNLGIQKSPPELGIYLSVIKRNDLSPRSDLEDNAPSARHNTFDMLFEITKDALINESDEPVRVDQIFETWRCPPFGVRSGVAPLLMMSFLLENRAFIAPYIDGRFVVEFDDLFVERLSRVPNTVSLRWAALDAAKGDLVEALAGSLVKKLAIEVTSTPLDVARQLVHFAHNLPNFSKSYRGGNHLIQLSGESLAFRAELLLADDPLKLLFEKLPKVFGVELDADDAIPVFLDKTEHAIDELNAVYPALIDDLQRLIESEFPTSGSKDRIDAIRETATSLQSKKFDPSYDRFIAALAWQGPDREWVERVAGRSIHKPVNRWLDADITEAKVQFVNMANRFRAIIELEHEVGGNVVSIGSRMSDGSVRTGHKLILADHSNPSIKKVSKRLKQIIEEEGLAVDEQIAALSQALHDLIDSKQILSDDDKELS